MVLVNEIVKVVGVEVGEIAKMAEIDLAADAISGKVDFALPLVAFVKILDVQHSAQVNLAAR